MTNGVQSLSGFIRFNAGLEDRWKLFAQRREAQLAQAMRFGSAPEKAAEDILKDFFTLALDWELGCINNQLEYADMVLTHQRLKKLLVEVKRPGSLALDRPSLNRALDQAYGYAQRQRVATIAVSDGFLFYAVDIRNGGFEERVVLRLDDMFPHPDLYWVSVDGIYRTVERLGSAAVENGITNPQAALFNDSVTEPADQLLHPKHGRPARCFAYVGNPLKTSTWKLPYRNADGSVDVGHLSGAIRALTTNYRGAHNKSVPEDAIPDVLVRLGKAAWEAGKMPGQTVKPLESYHQLYDALYQLDRLDEIKGAPVRMQGT